MESELLRAVRRFAGDVARWLPLLGAAAVVPLAALETGIPHRTQKSVTDRSDRIEKATRSDLSAALNHPVFGVRRRAAADAVSVTLDAKENAFLIGDSASTKGEATLLEARLDRSTGTVFIKRRDKMGGITMRPVAGVVPSGPATLREGSIVYPVADDLAVIATPSKNGLKEDIVLAAPRGDEVAFEWALTIPDGMEARLLHGRVNIYGPSSLLSSDIQIGDEKSRLLIEKARRNAKKTEIVYSLPAPVVFDASGKLVPGHAAFELAGQRLIVRARGLATLAYPISIDPSVTVTSTADFAFGGNAEYGVDVTPGNTASPDAKITRQPIVRGTEPWVQTTSFTNGRYGHATVAYNGYLYVIGGRASSGSTYYADIQYAPIQADGTVGAFATNAASLPTPLVHHAAVVYHGHLYIIGGTDGVGGYPTSVSKAAIASNGSVGSFTVAGTLPVTRYAATAVAQTGFLYVLGGSNSNAVYVASINADGTLGAFSTTVAFTSARQEHASVVYNGYVYVIGGYNSSTDTLYSSIQYAAIRSDGTLSTWTTSASTLPTARRAVTAGVYGGHLYVTGGSDAVGYKSDVLVGALGANGSVGSFSPSVNALTGNRAWHAGAVWNGYLYVTGDYITAGSSNSVLVARVAAKPNLGTWSTSSLIDTGRTGLAAVAYGGWLYAIGGCRGGTCYSDVQKAKINGDGTLGTFAATTSFSGVRDYHRAVAHNGYMYVLGGLLNGSTATPQSDVQMAPIDPDGNLGNFTGTTGFTTARWGHASVVANGYIYVIGGEVGGVSVADVQYAALSTVDGSVGLWSSTNSMNTVRRSHGAVVANGYLYVTGGYGAAGLTSVESTTLNSNGTVGAWAATTSMLTARRAHISFAHNGYLYAVGGYNSGALSSVTYAPLLPNGAVGPWTTNGTAMLNPRYYFGGVAYNGYAYVVSGQDTISYYDDVLFAEIPSRTQNGSLGAWFTSSGSFTTARRNHCAVAYKGTVYVAGGQDSSGASLNDVYYGNINGSTGDIAAWTSAGTFSVTARMLHSCVAVNGYFYVMGGYQSGTQTTSIVKAAINADGSLGAFGAANIGLATARNSFAVATRGNHVYVLGGYAGVTRYNDVRYTTIDSLGNLAAWTLTTAFPHARSLHQAVAYGDKLYVMGGGTMSEGLNNVHVATITTTGALGAYWTETTAFPTERIQFMAAAHNGQMYVYGGNAFISGNYTDVQVAPITPDGTLGAWSQTSSFTVVRREGAAAFTNGFLYATGGRNGAVYHANADYAYVKSPNLVGGWTNNASSLTTAVRGNALVGYNGYLYSTGGWTGAVYQSSVDRATANTNGSVGAFALVNNFATTRAYHGAVAHNGYMYVVGGSSSGISTTGVEYASIGAAGALGVWGSTSSLPTARHYISPVVYNGYIYVVGGFNSGGVYYSNVLYAPILATGAIGGWFTSATTFTTARRAAAVFANNGYLYVAGGDVAGSGLVYDVQFAPIQADGSPGTWSYTTALPRPVSRGYAVTSNGVVTLVAGSDGTGITGSVMTAPFLASGHLGAWTSSPNLNNVRDTGGTTIFNGTIYAAGGFNGGYMSSVEYASSGAPASSGAYSRVADTGAQMSLSNILVNGGAQAGNVRLAYKVTALTGGAFGSWVDKGNVTLGTAATLGDATRYAQFMFRLDDTETSTVNGEADFFSLERDVTDYAVTYNALDCGSPLGGASVRTFYVHTGGTDDCPCNYANAGTLAVPFKSVTKAATCLNDATTTSLGSTAHVSPGNYAATATVNLTRVATGANPISLLGDPTCTTTAGIAGGCTAGDVNLLEPPDPVGPTTVSTVEFTGAKYNRVAGFRVKVNATLAEAAGIRLTSSSTNNTIENNTIVSAASGNMKFGIDLDSSAINNNVIRDNTVSTSTTKTSASSPDMAIRVSGDSNLVDGNIVTPTGYTRGIDVTGSTNTVSQNTITFSGEGSYAIQVYDGDNNILSDNIIDESAKPTSPGAIAVKGNATGNTFSRNRITGSVAPIYLPDATTPNNTFEDTTILNCRGTCVQISGPANTTFRRISIAFSAGGPSTTRRGFYVTSSTNTVLVEDYSLTDFVSASARYGFYTTGAIGQHSITIRRCSIALQTTSGTQYGIAILSNPGAASVAEKSTIDACDVSAGWNAIRVLQRYVDIRSTRVTNKSQGTNDAIVIANPDVTLDGVEVYNSVGHGLTIPYTASSVAGAKVVVKNSYLHDNTTNNNGIKIGFDADPPISAAHEISNNWIKNMRSVGIRTSKASNLVFRGNLLEWNNSQFLLDASTANAREYWCYSNVSGQQGEILRPVGGIFFYAENRITNVALGCTASGAQGWTDNSVIEGNIIRNNYGVGVWLYGGKNNTFRNNVIQDNIRHGIVAESIPVYMFSVNTPREASGNIFDGNAFVANEFVGLKLVYAPGTVVINNVFTQNGRSGGGLDKSGLVKLTYPWGVDQGQMKQFATGDVINNLFYANTSYGIYVEQGSGGTYRENTFYANGVSGIVTAAATDACYTTSPPCSTAWNPGTPNPNLTLRNNSFSSHSPGAGQRGVDNGGSQLTCASTNDHFFSNSADVNACPQTNPKSGDPLFGVATTTTADGVNGPDNVLGWAPGNEFAWIDDNFRVNQVVGDPGWSGSPSPLVDQGVNLANSAAEQFPSGGPLMSTRSTRFDAVADVATSNVDIGFHYPSISAAAATATLTLGAGGGIVNAFADPAQRTVNDAKLHEFTIQNSSLTSAATVYGVTFDLSFRIGLLKKSWTSVRLYEDSNGTSGLQTTGATPDNTVGGYGDVKPDAISRSTGTIVFLSPFVVPANTTQRYFLVANFPSLLPLEQTRVDLYASKITLGAGSLFSNPSAALASPAHKFTDITGTNGTVGNYYNGLNPDTDTLVSARLDPTINLASAPTPATDAYGVTGLGTQWSARWYGAFYAPCSGDYTLYVDPEGSFKLATEWNTDFDLGETSAEQSVTMRDIKTFLSGVNSGWHPFALTYKESGAAGSSQLELRYSATCGGITKQVIPQTALATIADPSGIGRTPVVNFSCAPSSTIGYELTDRSIAVNFTSNVLTTARLYYRTTSGPGAWNSNNASLVPSTSHTIAALGLNASTQYDLAIAVTDMNGYTTAVPGTDADPTTAPFCSPTTNAAAPWCARTAYLTSKASGVTSRNKMLAGGPDWPATPGHFVTGPEASTADDFFAEIGVDPPTGLLSEATAIFSPTVNPCAYYVQHDDSLIWKIGAINNTYPSAGTDAINYGSLGWLPLFLRVQENAGMAAFRVTRLCPWRGETTPQPIPDSEWATYCGGPVVLNPTGGVVGVGNTWAMFQESVNYGWIRVDYGTLPTSLTKCAGRCPGTYADTNHFNSWNYVTIHDLSPSTTYYYQITEVHKTGATSAGAIQSFVTSGEPGLVTGGLNATYYSGMNHNTSVVTRVDSTVDFTEAVGVWPPAGVPADGFSAKWSGQMQIPDDCDQQPVTFYLTARHGARLKVDTAGVAKPELIDWVDRGGAVERAVTLQMAMGWHPLEISMYHDTGAPPSGGLVKFEWAGATSASPACKTAMPRAVVPSSRLSAGAPSDTTPPTISKTCADPAPGGGTCTTTSELTVGANATCESTVGQTTTEVFDVSTPITTCWGPTSAGSCAGATGWPSLFPLGTTVVKVLAIDNFGNAADASVSVRVADQTPPNSPVVTLSPGVVEDAGSPKVLASTGGCDLTFQATSGNATVTARNYFDASSSDNCGAPTITSPGSTVVPVSGSAVVEWRATDPSGLNSAWVPKTLCAKDVVAPTIVLPGSPATASCTGDPMKVTLSAPTVTDDNDPAPYWKWELPDAGDIWDCDAGSQPLGWVTAATSQCGKFGYGSSQIRVQAKDWVGLLAVSAAYTVNVTDNVAPTVTLQSQVPAASATNDASVVTTWSVSDMCNGLASPGLTVSHTGSGSATFNDAGSYTVTTTVEGAHSVLVTATDLAGNSANATRNFIIDRAPPILVTGQKVTSTDPTRPNWFFYSSLEQPGSYAATDQPDAAVATNLAVVQVDIWKNGVAAPDAGQNLLAYQTDIPSATNNMCQIFLPGSICRLDEDFGDGWDFRRLGRIGSYEIYVTAQDMAGNFASGSVAIDGGPRQARKYYLMLARLAQAIDETVNVTTTIGDAGTAAWRMYMATARKYAQNMQRAWAHDIGVDRAATGDPPTSTIFASDWGYSWDAGSRPWESLPAGARRTLFLDQSKFDPRKGLRGRMLETVHSQMGDFYWVVEAAIDDPSAGSTAADRDALRWTKWLLARGYMAENDLYMNYLEDAGWTPSVYALWGDYEDRSLENAVRAWMLLDSADAGADYTNAWQALKRVGELSEKAEYEYEVPFATNQFATNPTDGKKRMPSQIAVEANTTKARAVWWRLVAEETAWKAFDASIPVATEYARRFVGEALPGSGLVEQAWPPLRRDFAGTMEPYPYDAGAQYTQGSAGANFDGVVPLAYVKRDGGPPTWNYVPPGADAGQYMRFANVGAIVDVIEKFKFCRRDSHCPGSGEVCILFDPDMPLDVGLPDTTCDPNSSGYGGMLHGYTPALIASDAGFIVNSGNAYGKDYWKCPASGWCSGSSALGTYRPSPLQYAGAIFAEAELAKHAVGGAAAGRGASTLMNGIAYGLTERIFSMVAPAAALMCPAELSNVDGTCDGDDAGAATIASLCAQYGSGAGRCQRKLETRNTLRAAWGTALRSVASCYDPTILDCPADGGVGNCVWNTASPVPLCAYGVSDISNCAVEACNPAGAFSIVDTNMCNFQHVLNLAFQYPITKSSEAYYRIPSFSGYPGCAPTVGNEPLPPSNVAASAGNNLVTLTWNASAGATSYKVYRGTATGVMRTTGTLVGSPTTTNYTDGTVANGTTYYFVVTALNASGESTESFEARATPSAGVSGTLDTTFNGVGFATHHDAGGAGTAERAMRVTISDAGRIYAAGEAQGPSANLDAIVWSFLPDGGLDTGFGGKGFVSSGNVAGGNGLDVARALAIDSMDRAVVVGYSYNASNNYDVVVWRYNANGTLDPTFGAAATGFVVYNSGFAGAASHDYGNGVGIDPWGRIVVAGYSYTGASTAYDGLLLRLTDGGVLDPTFGTGGAAFYNASTGGALWDLMSDLAFTPSGDAIVVGYSQPGVNLYDATLWKVFPDGGLDPAFGTAGVFKHSGLSSSAITVSRGLAIDGTGRIVMSGYSQVSPSPLAAMVWRVTAGGTLDTTFNDAGFASWTGAASGDAYFTGLRVDSAGRYVVSGYGQNGTTRDMAVVRYLPDGGFDPTFGSGGVLFHNSAAGGGGVDEGWGLAFDSQGRIVVVGKSWAGGYSDYDMAIWRVNP